MNESKNHYPRRKIVPEKFEFFGTNFQKIHKLGSIFSIS